MIEVTLPLPPSINATYKTGNGRFYKSKKAKEWEEEAGWLVKKKRAKKLTGDVWMTMEIFITRKRDIDSTIKICQDLMQNTGVIDNDDSIYSLSIIKHLKGHSDGYFGIPRIDIQIGEIL